jgi:hypothetical protein
MPNPSETVTTIKNLVPVGEDLGIVIDRPLLDELHIHPGTLLKVTSDGTRLYIEPIPAEQSRNFLEAGRQMMNIHDEAFRKLAQ